MRRGLGSVDLPCRDGTVETAALDPCRNAPCGLSQEQHGERFQIALVAQGRQGLGARLDGGGGGALLGKVREQRLVREGGPPLEQALGAKEEGLVHEGAGFTRKC